MNVINNLKLSFLFSLPVGKDIYEQDFLIQIVRVKFTTKRGFCKTKALTNTSTLVITIWHTIIAENKKNVLTALLRAEKEKKWLI